jgi:hypothetical protein
MLWMQFSAAMYLIYDFFGFMQDKSGNNTQQPEVSLASGGAGLNNL